MNNNLTKYLIGWNPVSIMILGVFSLFAFCVVWYVVTNMQPATWLISLGTIVFGSGTFGLGGLLAALHGQVVRQGTLDTVQQATKNGNSTPIV